MAKVNTAQSLVNKSAPVIETIINPTGNKAPAISCTSPGLFAPNPGIPPDTIIDNKPPNAINAPPNIASKLNWAIGISIFAFTEDKKLNVVSFGL